MNNYEEFLKSKKVRYVPSGFDVPDSELHREAFEFERDIVRWALKKGKAAIFADCGLGKTFMQLMWADAIHRKTGQDVLILAPLAVSSQTKREAERFGFDAAICKTTQDIRPGINITNYERLHYFEGIPFAGVVLDESSILKSFYGKTKQELIDRFRDVPYRLACTATPAPNDFMELGNHSEFLGVMNGAEMLATYFINDGEQTAQWRLKGHAERDFWQWVAGWAIVIRNPADFGYKESSYDLPDLNIIEQVIPAEADPFALFAMPAETLEERRNARKASMNRRVSAAAEITNRSDDQWIIWCDFNAESEALAKSIHDSVEVKGSDTPEHKENSGIGFADGKIRCLISKPAIYGFGMNWQNCHKIIFCGLSDSYEQFYQAVRRCYRFGQTKPVDVHIIISKKEINALRNIQRKAKQAETMDRQMMAITREVNLSEIRQTNRQVKHYNADKSLSFAPFLKGTA